MNEQALCMSYEESVNWISCQLRAPTPCRCSKCRLPLLLPQHLPPILRQGPQTNDTIYKQPRQKVPFFLLPTPAARRCPKLLQHLFGRRLFRSHRLPPNLSSIKFHDKTCHRRTSWAIHNQNTTRVRKRGSHHFQNPSLVVAATKRALS